MAYSRVICCEGTHGPAPKNLAELRGLAGFEWPKCLKLLAPDAESLHYRVVGGGTGTAVILGGGCGGSLSLSFSSSSLSSGSGSV